jgi:uncharacterized membrane protein
VTIDRGLVTGLIVASAMALARPLLALADAVPPPGTPPAGDQVDVSAFAPYVGLAIVILVAIVAIRWPGSRRPIAVAFVAIVTTLAAAIAAVFRAFSCFDCAEKPDQTPSTILAIVIAIVGVVLIILIMRIGRSSSPAADAPSNRTD